MFGLRHKMTSDVSAAMTTSVLMMHLALVGGIANLFYPEPNTAYQNKAYGTIRYNNSQYLATCGWKLIFTTNYPMCSIILYDATVETLDNYTYILTNVGYAADLTYRVSAITLLGLYGNTMPKVIINWFCVCDKTTGGACQNVTYETVAPQNTASSTIPCPTVSTLPPTTARTTTTPATTTTTPATTTTTPATTTKTPATTTTTPATITTTPATTTTTPATTTTTTRRQTPSIPLLSLLDIQISSNPHGRRIALKRFGASCYTGALYQPVLQVAHFIDCCSSCCAYTSCLGVNFLPASQECDLVFENVTTTSSPLLKTMADCSFWKVIYRS